MNKDMKRYFRDCQSLFPSFGKEEKNYLNKIKNNIEYDDSTLNYKELVERLGEPKNIIISYYEEKDSMFLIKKARTTQLLKRFLFILLVIIIIFLGFKAHIYQQEYNEIKDSYNGYFEETIE